MATSVQELAFGELRRDPQSGRFAARLIGIADVQGMPDRSRNYLVSHLTDLFHRDDDHGRSQRGWWNEAPGPEEIIGLCPGGSTDFASAAEAALDRLTTAVPGTAAPGLIALCRFSESDEPYLAILKLEIEEADLFTFSSASEAEGVISYEHLENVLPNEGVLHKAALIPNPSGSSSDLRVLDQDYAPETARYWLAFLGVRVVPPTPRALRTVVQGTSEALSRRVSNDSAREYIGDTLAELANSGASTTPRDFVNRAATRSGIPATDLWPEVEQSIDQAFPSELPISAPAIERLVTEIVFHVRGQKVSIRGPADALEGRYTWEATANGYVLTIRSDDEPETKTALKTGR